MLEERIFAHPAETIIIASPTALYAITKSRVLQDYMGSFFTQRGKTFLILPPLAWQHTVNYGAFLIKRYLTKLSAPDDWPTYSPFKYRVVDEVDAAESADTYFNKYGKSATAVAVDIETLSDYDESADKWTPVITCLSICDIDTLETICIPLRSEQQYLLAKRILEAPIPKIFQNGKYDISYLLLWRIETAKYYFDTMNLAHAIYSELPKRLSFIASFYLREVTFWKDENTMLDQQAHYRYNAKDAYNTACVFLAQLRNLPDYAYKNYLRQFPKEHVCLYMGFNGLPLDTVALKDARATTVSEVEKLGEELEAFTYKGFNPNSPKQVLDVINAMLGWLKKPLAKSTDDAVLRELSVTHPLLAVFIDKLVKYRERSKYFSTYLNAKPLCNKIFYTISTCGTDTGRLSSAASSFSYCVRIKRNGEGEWENFGTQIQNLPPEYRKVIRAPEGWKFAEVDYAQSESRCTAYLAQDTTLIQTVESSPDFHSTNASLFFGIPFEQLYDVKEKKKLNKELRDLAKRVNHGANYNMGAGVLLQTMGLQHVRKAQELLKLPKDWGPLAVCEYLLKCFDTTYPRIRKGYYNEVTKEILETKKLVSPLGWTRYCFGDPLKKLNLNAYVAHGPQNLSVQILNEGMAKVYAQLVDKTFRLLAQIHDSLLIMYKDTPENIEKLHKVVEFVTIPVTIHGRTMVIPPELSYGKDVWGDLK
jgi:DNA polymerase I-like protein with 3'-5' exonuclease and polymerase domains